MELENKITRIKEKITELLDLNMQLVNEKNVLAEELNRLKANEADSLKKIDELENKSLNLQIDQSIENKDKNKLKIYLEDLINEIDKGIKLLKS